MSGRAEVEGQVRRRQRGGRGERFIVTTEEAGFRSVCLSFFCNIS